MNKRSRIITIANQKGGVGKTTTAINLATALAAIGETVLIVDLDPQGNASTGLGIDRQNRPLSSYDMVPLQCEFFALEGLSQLLQTVNQVRSTINPELTIQGIVLTMFDSRNNLASQVVEDVRAFMGEKVYRTVIPRNVRVSEAPSHGKPAILYDLKCAGSQAYLQLASEVIQRERQLQAA